MKDTTNGGLLLELRGLRASIAGKQVLGGIDLDVRPGEVHAIMGPNGAGKSSLAAVLAGKPGYEVEADVARLDGVDLLGLEPETRAHLGLFLGFQHPVELPGVNNSYLLRSAVNAARRYRGEPEVDAYDFLQTVRAKARALGLDEALLARNVNEGFSGGERKRNEILQLAVLEPRLAVLDEIDSGLDIDALRQVAAGINRLRSAERSFVLVTHYRRLLDYVAADQVHVMIDGRIEASGDMALVDQLEERGYDWIGRGAEQPVLAE
jgi:Fe-S cluster assembly ATP-binding protein